MKAPPLLRFKCHFGLTRNGLASVWRIAGAQELPDGVLLSMCGKAASMCAGAFGLNIVSTGGKRRVRLVSNIEAVTSLDQSEIEDFACGLANEAAPTEASLKPHSRS
jgi:hypothetical protein